MRFESPYAPKRLDAEGARNVMENVSDDECADNWVFAPVKNLCIALLSLVVLLAAVPPALAQGSFTSEQKSEIGAIVREYLLRNPEVLQEAFAELERRAREQQAAEASRAIAKNAAAIFRSDDDFVAGNPQGDVTVVEFFDYNCHYCRKSMSDVTKLIDTDKNLRVVLKEFPILGPDSLYAAKAALAARRQGKYWQFHQALFSASARLGQEKVLAVAKDVGLDVAQLQKDMKDPSMAKVIDANLQLAAALGINGTPAFVIGETLVPGAVGFDSLSGTIAALREAGGCAVC
jgi:protein-disulfide isomerase